jgi:hypothetical protein
MAYIKRDKVCDMLNRHFKHLTGHASQILVSDIKQDLLELPVYDVIDIEDVIAFCRAKEATAKTSWEVCSSNEKMAGYELALNTVVSYLNTQRKKNNK